MRVRFFAHIRDITGCVEADIPHQETVGALARSICELYGEAMRQKIFLAGNSDEAFSPEIIFLINGRHVTHLGGTAAALQPDDRVDIFPMVAGG